MKKFSFSAFLMGLGLGMIFSFFFVNITSSATPDLKEEVLNIPDELIIRRAKELGLIDPAEGIKKEEIKLDEDNY